MNGFRKEGVMMSEANIDSASNLVSTQIDMGDAGKGLQDGVETVDGLFSFMKGFSESFSSFGSCYSNCKSGSIVGDNSITVMEGPDLFWALSVSEQLYELNTQVLILTGLMVLFIVIYLAKPYFVYRVAQRNKLKKKEDASKRPLD
jgi:hypothetical protein